MSLACCPTSKNCVLNCSQDEAVLGAEISVSAPDGSVTMKIIHIGYFVTCSVIIFYISILV